MAGNYLRNLGARPGTRTLQSQFLRKVAEHSSCDQHGTAQPAWRSYKVEALEAIGHDRSVSRTSPQILATVYTRIAREAAALHCASWSGALCFTPPHHLQVFFWGSRCGWDRTEF